MTLLKTEFPKNRITNTIHRSYKGEVSNANPGANLTLHTVTKCPEGRFSRVRGLYKNKYSSGSTPAFGGSIFAISDGSAGKIIPSVGNTKTNDYKTGWVDVLFSGSATPTLPEMGTVTNDAGLLVSDWMPLHSMAPNDGTALPYIFSRTYINTSPHSVLTHGTAAYTLDPTKETYIESFAATGDFVTTPESMTTGTRQSISNIFGFEFEVANRYLKILIIGDSIAQGSDGTANVDFYGWSQIAEASMRAKGMPVSILQYGYQGQSTSISAAIGMRAIDTHKPNVIMIPIGSVYSLIDNGWLETFYQRAMSVVDYAFENGVYPILMNLMPVNGITAAADKYRIELIRRCKASGVTVCDMSVAVATTNAGGTIPTEPQLWIPGTTDDLVHPNTYGYSQMAPIFENTITKLLYENNLMTRYSTL